MLRGSWTVVSVHRSQARTVAASGQRQSRLDVCQGQRLVKQRIVEQVDLADREVISRPPPSHARLLVSRQRLGALDYLTAIGKSAFAGIDHACVGKFYNAGAWIIPEFASTHTR